MAEKRFDRFAVIDWSGAKTRLQKGIAIATCDHGKLAPRLVDPAERHWSREAVLEWLLKQRDAGHNMLIGLDLSPSLPFHDQDAFFPGWAQSPKSAKALWQLVEEMTGDEPYLAANQFVGHSEIARHFRQQGNCGDLFGTGAGRMRRCESHGQKRIKGINPYSCFNLVGAAQVGKSSLTGMRVLHRLGGRIPVWPFDPLPETGPAIVEIYTSVAARATSVLAMGKSKILEGAQLDRALRELGCDEHAPLPRYTDHATDAILTAAWLRTVAHRAELWNPSELTPHIAATEGWTFGVI